MWDTSFFCSLKNVLHFNILDACEYGSPHKKPTAFLSNFVLPRLTMTCTATHSHQKWKLQQDTNGEWHFDTAKAAEYPTRLAKAIALALLDKVMEPPCFSLTDDVEDHAVKISAQNQPRRTRGPLLLSEFKHKVCIQFDPQDIPPKIIPADAQPPWQGIPVGSKLISVHPVSLANGGDKVSMNASYGVYFSPTEFLQAAMVLQHPFDIPLSLDISNLRSIATVLEKGPAEMAKFQALCEASQRFSTGGGKPAQDPG